MRCVEAATPGWHFTRSTSRPLPRCGLCRRPGLEPTCRDSLQRPGPVADSVRPTAHPIFLREHECPAHGTAITERLVRDGMAVALLDISGEKVAARAAAITAMGGRALGLRPNPEWVRAGDLDHHAQAIGDLLECRRALIRTLPSRRVDQFLLEPTPGRQQRMKTPGAETSGVPHCDIFATRAPAWPLRRVSAAGAVEQGITPSGPVRRRLSRSAGCRSSYSSTLRASRFSRSTCRAVGSSRGSKDVVRLMPRRLVKSTSRRSA